MTDALICVQKMPRDEAEARGRDLLAKMGLAGKEEMVPCAVSGGQQQRVAIARALAMNPDVLFFDEPTSALDPELTREVLRVIRELADEDMTMVIVTHEMSFARDVADQIIFMDGGVIVEQGAASEVIGNPRHERTRVSVELRCGVISASRLDMHSVSSVQREGAAWGRGPSSRIASFAMIEAVCGVPARGRVVAGPHPTSLPSYVRRACVRAREGTRLSTKGNGRLA